MDAKKTAAVILSTLVFESSDDSDQSELEPPQKRKRVWVKDWVLRREQEGFCIKLYRELRDEEPALYNNFVRMNLQQFNHLLSLVSPLIVKKDTHLRKSIPPADRLLVTLRFLATGESFRSLQYLFRIPWCTIATIVPEVVDAIYKVLVGDYLQTPRTPEAWEAIARDFDEKWQFPNCIGAVDGKHVAMVAPPHSGSVFYNYKGTHSIVLMGVADAKYKLMYVDFGRNGKFSDGGVFNRSTFAQAMDTNQLGLPAPKALPGRILPVPFTLVANDAFALRPNLMKPYSQRGLTMVKRVFNYRLSRARRLIENVFDIMAARFRVLLKPIHLNAEKTKKVVLACCVLHNYLMTTNKNNYAPSNAFDRFNENGDLIPGEWREEVNRAQSTLFPLEAGNHASPPSAKEVQEEFTSYFVEEGELQWQYGRI